MTRIKKIIKNIEYPVLLAISSVLVVKVLEIKYPMIYLYSPVRIFQSIIIWIIGFSLGVASKKHALVKDIIWTFFLVILLIYITPKLIESVFGIVLVMVCWIGALYWLEVGVYKLIREIYASKDSKKQIFLKGAKIFVEVITFAVAVLELVNLLITQLRF